MKKFKKLIALTCVAAMLVPSIAFAAEPETTPGAGTTSTGDSVIENNNATDIKYTAVVLPTIDAGTYDFTIDREGLLDKFDSTNEYNTGDSVFFKAEKTAASVAVVASGDTSTNKLVEIGKAVDIDGEAEVIATEISASALYEALNGNTLTAAKSDVEGKYFVWSPAKDTEGKYNNQGTWVEIVFVAYTPAGGAEELEANYDDYLKLTFATPGDSSTAVSAIELQADPLSGETLWDGNIYTIGYNEITDGAKAVEKYNIVASGTTIQSMSDGLYVENTSGDGNTITYTAITTANAATTLTYTEATEWYNSKSDKAAVTNKSTNPIAVSVDVTVTAPGLTFNQTGTYTDDTAASVYFTLNADTNKAVVDTKGKATAYYVLDGAAVTPILFQGTDTNAATGSKNYYNYAAPELVGTADQYDSQDFYIQATANTTEGSEDAWDAYIADVKDTQKTEIVKPTIAVVYNWVPLNDEVATTANTDNPGTADVETNATIKTYKDADGKEYVICDAASQGWVVKSGASVVAPTEAFVNYVTAKGRIWIDLAEDNKGAMGDGSQISNLKVAVNNGEAVTVAHTVSGGSILVTTDQMTAAGATVAAGKSYKFTFDYDGTSYEVTLTVPAS